MCRAFLLSILISMLFFSCEKNNSCNFEGFYEFKVPISLAVLSDTVHLGDTIILQANFSDQVYETKTNREYLLKDFKFYPATSIFRIDTDPPNDDDLYSVIDDDFEIILDSVKYDYQIFRYSDGSSALIGQYKYQNGRYNLIVKVIPLRTGLYTLRHINRVGSYDERQNFKDKCSDKFSEAHTVLNNDENTNIEFLHDSPRDYWNSWVLEKPGDRYYQAGGYTFYVVE